MFFIFSKNEVIGSGVGEGRGGRFVPGNEKDLTENVKRETTEISGKGILLRNKFVKKNNCRRERERDRETERERQRERKRNMFWLLGSRSVR